MQQIPRSIFERAALIDSSALYALADSRDTNHQEAVNCLRLIAQHRLPLWVTNFTVVETHRRILQSLGGTAGLAFLQNIYDGGLTIERAFQTDEQQARSFLQRFSDQSISYCDAISFAIMKRLGIGKAFAFDWHFRLIGFVTIPPFYV
ncbi:MAG: PIN domain-containing protein [Chloroflexota bacterium]